MKNREIKTRNQIKLLELIKKEISPSMNLVDAVSEKLGVAHAATYRRMRGEKIMSFDEAVKLCNAFNISMDSFVSVTNQKLIQCHYTPLNLSDIKDFILFVQTSLESFENIKKAKGELILTAVDIPIFHLLPYKELTLFKLFSWSKSVYDFTGDYEAFVKETDGVETLSINYKKILDNYRLIPSTEVWTDNTTDTIVRLIRHHFIMEHFDDKETPILLCNQLMDLMDTLQEWTKNGTKELNTPFKFYVCETDIANTFILFKSAKRSNCMVRLYTINGLGISDESFCKETENWLQKSIQQSILISGTAERERINFFNAQRKKITNLIDKINVCD